MSLHVLPKLMGSNARCLGSEFYRKIHYDSKPEGVEEHISVGDVVLLSPDTDDYINSEMRHTLWFNLYKTNFKPEGVNGRIGVVTFICDNHVRVTSVIDDWNWEICHLSSVVVQPRHLSKLPPHFFTVCVDFIQQSYERRMARLQSISSWRHEVGVEIES
ncbi:hypothetical protein TUMSATVNIG1_61380 (plasmid) [Vibrio nigripulchritudo]|uniref:hypothetical protein n=1 Tax=Vibrio nigripulchritudo TaxID=28173 RepID=UPI0019097F01|nr:hypothetical protein [Vibrio nigripulchritudo]BCL74154.1 hypothetical protein VNTUMSATTG_60910 [Vibrio nigripulchritudo]BDU35529.1 hypothetical protein TUMSATVNIG1_61380 [Vibrio nigripulchritudo]